jgi:hypothetical protein
MNNEDKGIPVESLDEFRVNTLLRNITKQIAAN